MVGTGANPNYPTTSLFLWDDKEKEMVAEVEFSKQITDLKVVGEWVVLTDDKTCFVFNLSLEQGMEQSLAQFPLRKFRPGLMDVVSHTDGAITLLIPDCDSVGHARLIHIPIDSKPMQTKVIDVFGKKEDF